MQRSWFIVPKNMVLVDTFQLMHQVHLYMKLALIISLEDMTHQVAQIQYFSKVMHLQECMPELFLKEDLVKLN